MERGAPQKTSETQPGSSFLPDFCRIRAVFAVVVTAELMAIVLALASLDRWQQFASDLSLYSLMVQWVALPGAGLICLLRPWLQRQGDTRAGLLAWLLLMLVTLAVLWSAHGLLPEAERPGALGLYLLRGLGISAVLSALILRYLYVQHLWRAQVEAESRARFQALQSRIRPHFLFNSMNTIANLTRSDPELAEEVVQDLSDLFRASLGDSRRLSTLQDELELCRGYLRIEQQRLGDRLQVTWELQELPGQASLPALVLQPLLENAVYHGIEPSASGGRITISGVYRRNRVNLGIRNTRPEGGNASHRQGNRMALENIRQRLLGCFGDEATLRSGEVDGEYQVRLVFPYPWRP